VNESNGGEAAQKASAKRQHAAAWSVASPARRKRVSHWKLSRGDFRLLPPLHRGGGSVIPREAGRTQVGVHAGPGTRLWPPGSRVGSGPHATVSLIWPPANAGQFCLPAPAFPFAPNTPGRPSPAGGSRPGNLHPQPLMAVRLSANWGSASWAA